MMNGRNTDTDADDRADVLLQQLLHLKRYETPAVDRMTRNKNNIMRRVREVNGKKRWSFADMLEMNMPWFFAEPRYGVALLFIIFAGLQFVGQGARRQAQQGRTGIYTSSGNSVASVNQSVTNSVSYPKFPDRFKLFPEQERDGGVKFVGRLEEQK